MVETARVKLQRLTIHPESYVPETLVFDTPNVCTYRRTYERVDVQMVARRDQGETTGD
jgi:hypothetical protein